MVAIPILGGAGAPSPPQSLKISSKKEQPILHHLIQALLDLGYGKGVALPSQIRTELEMASPPSVFRHPGGKTQIALEERKIVVYQQAGLVEKDLPPSIQGSAQDLLFPDCQIRDTTVLDSGHSQRLESEAKPVVERLEVLKILKGRGDLRYHRQHELTGGEHNGAAPAPAAKNRNCVRGDLLEKHVFFRLPPRPHDEANLFLFIETIQGPRIPYIEIEQVLVYAFRRLQAPNLASFSAAARARRISMTPGMTPHRPAAQLRSPNSAAASGRRFRA